MLEIEAKYRVDDWQRIEARLAEVGARLLEEREERDLYFNAPHRDFARSDEAVRIRQVGESNWLTYKGPRTDAHTKTRREIEVPLAAGSAAFEAARNWLEVLGFRPVRQVHKKRRVYELERNSRRIHVSLDDVPGLGEFVELEILATEGDFPAAKAELLQLAAELQLTRQERRSYLEMVLSSERAE